MKYNITSTAVTTVLGIAVLWMATGSATNSPPVLPTQYISCFSGETRIYAGVGKIVRHAADFVVLVEAQTQQRIVFYHAVCRVDPADAVGSKEVTHD